MSQTIKTTTTLLKDKFRNIYQLCNNSINKFILLLRKGVYPYEYMNEWNKFDETELPTKDKFYSSLNREYITYQDYQHAKAVWNTFEINNLGDYHDLYVQLDILLLADVFENFRTINPCYFVSTPGLAIEACLIMTRVKLELLTDINMILMFEKGIHRYASANNKYMSNYSENIPSAFLTYLDANNLYGWAMSRKLPLNGFRWSKNIKQYTADFIKKL